MRTIDDMIEGRNAPIAPGSDGLGFRLVDLDAHDCRFPIRQDRDGIYFCAEESAEAGSYCAFHAAYLSGQAYIASRAAPPAEAGWPSGGASDDGGAAVAASRERRRAA